MQLRLLKTGIACAALLLPVCSGIVTAAEAGEPAPANSANQTPAAAIHVADKLPSGAKYLFDVPQPWNGTVLLFSHGYSAAPDNPARNDARGEKEWLLAHGYALIGSSYSTTGWALAEAFPDQIATLDAFVARFGKPKHTIAWGTSMGGLITIALMERFPQRFDAAVAFCASASGTIGMMNASLDGAFVFRTLASPSSDLPLRINRTGTDAKADLSAWKQALDRAQSTSEGRARIALAATIAQVSTWSDGTLPKPDSGDFAAQEEQLYRGFVGWTLLPRDDQEKRAGGNFSWTTGVDYRNQLKRSGREDFVGSLYRQAGLNLDDDLDTLARAPRVAADANAVAYMKANYVPSGKVEHPILAVQAVADPVTLVELTGAYADLVRTAGHPDLIAAAYVERSGHCNFSRAETIAALLAAEKRTSTGSWDTIAGPEAMNALAESLHLDGGKFVQFAPSPFVRACTAREAKCTGEP